MRAQGHFFSPSLLTVKQSRSNDNNVRHSFSSDNHDTTKPKHRLHPGPSTLLRAGPPSYPATRIDTPVGPAHITINAGKGGSDVAADAEAITRLVSLVLQLQDGLTPAERAAAVITQLGGIGSARAVGFGPNKVGSLADAVAKALAE